jgi:hypothetical protein
MNEPPVSNSSSTSLPATDDRPQLIRQHDSPDRSIKENSGPVATGGNAEVHDRTGLYISIIALLVGGLALGFEMNRSATNSEIQRLQDQAIDAKIAAAIAKSEQTSHAADTNARVALDKVQNIKVELAKRGITVKDD